VLEWRVPFASLAGDIANPASNFGELGIEWPLYTPEDGDVIVFDIDLTDEDRTDANGGNFFRYSQNGSLWRDSFNFGGRGVVTDVSEDDVTANIQPILYGGTDVTVDGDLSDWEDASFFGMSQDAPNKGFFVGGDSTESANDFSAFVAMKMDDDAIYFAANVRDEDGVGIHTPYTNDNAGVMWQNDHFAAYLGLFDIGDRAGSPHTDLASIYLASQDSVLSDGARTYRISPDYDGAGTTGTLGADYQIGTPIQFYNTTNEMGAFVASGMDVITKNWGYVDNTIADTDVALMLREDADGVYGYVLEWRVPFASLAGDIANPASNFGELGIEWPLYAPEDGDVIVFDIDLTDEDRTDANGGNFFRYSQNGSLWRDSFNFGGRGLVVASSATTSPTFIETITDELPSTFALGQNYPNPFAGETVIPFDVTATSQVRVTVFDVLGRTVGTLLDAQLAPGSYETRFDASSLSAGVYLYRIEAGEHAETRRMMIVR
jgi:hypothetical protein